MPAETAAARTPPDPATQRNRPIDPAEIRDRARLIEYIEERLSICDLIDEHLHAHGMSGPSDPTIGLRGVYRALPGLGLVDWLPPAPWPTLSRDEAFSELRRFLGLLRKDAPADPAPASAATAEAPAPELPTAEAGETPRPDAPRPAAAPDDADAHLETASEHPPADPHGPKPADNLGGDVDPYQQVIDGLRNRRKPAATRARLLECMKERKELDFLTAAIEVHEDENASDDAIVQNVSRANEDMEAAGLPRRLATGCGRIYWENRPR